MPCHLRARFKLSLRSHVKAKIAITWCKSQQYLFVPLLFGCRLELGTMLTMIHNGFVTLPSRMDTALLRLKTFLTR